MSDYAREHTIFSGEQLVGLSESTRRKQPAQQARQLLSCTKCRDRKVKCDRTKPCSACCARGQPKDCHFVAEAGDYAPIQQSYELKRLRAENLRLKERLRASQIPIDEEDSDLAPSPDSQLDDRPSSSQKRRAAKQRRFQGSEWQDSIYFGSPGLVTVVADFATTNANPTSASLAHLMPRGVDMFTPKSPPPHPFPTFFAATPEQCIPQLLECLPQGEELLKRLSAFEDRVNVCSFPHVPFEITRSEVDRFLSDAKKNAQVCPEMLALLFAALALGGQHSVWDRSGGQWNSSAMHKEAGSGSIWIAAAMQALRLASFMHKPSLLGIQALVMIGPYLTNSGRFLDAWTLFGTTIRLAHSIGLHRHPKHLSPAPPTQRECAIRQTLWWWMLHMDEQYSMTLGRPLGISGIGDCPPPLELTSDRHMLRFGDFVHHFTILARRVLGSDRLNTAKIDELTDDFRALMETMPEILQFDRSWIEDEEIPEWPLNAMAAVYHCKAHTYLLLLNRQRPDKHPTQAQTPSAKASTPGFRSINRSTPSSQASPTTTVVPLRGRNLVLASAEEVLDAFIFLFLRVPAALISWTMGQQAFNACMILILDAMELKKITSGVASVEKAFAVFRGLEGAHKLAGQAVERISWGLKELRDVTQAPTGAWRANTDNVMQGVWSEAMHGALCGDTVMNATGMLLLEDAGWQGYVPEAFTPISWDLVDDETSAHQRKYGRNFTYGESRNSTGKSHAIVPDENPDEYRSVDVMQGMQRSATMRSAPTSFATRKVDDPQPQGVTAPTPGKSLTGPRSEQQQQQHQNRTTSIRGPQSKDQRSSFQHAQVREDHIAWEHQMTPAPSTAPILHTGRVQDLGQGLMMQMRHNSCPSIPHAAAASRAAHSSAIAANVQPPAAKRHPRPRPSVISDQASFQDFTSSAASHESSWAATAAGRPSASFQMPDSSLGLGQDESGLIHGLDHGVATSYPMHFSQAAPVGMATTAGQLSVEDWRRWMGSSGPG